MIVNVFRGYKYVLTMQYLRKLVRKLDKDCFAEDNFSPAVFFRLIIEFPVA